ncbi:MAG: hypothetical protein JWN34_5097 [Bryobacterales bacterium]|nr:hypothetical protein [Bryobacterales bacterium]
MPGQRLQILDGLLKTAERNFEAAVKHAATVDDKAQKTSGLAGIFLAVAFGFIKPETLAALRQQYGGLSLGLLYGALFLFVTTVILCLRAMWLRKVPSGGVSIASQELAADFLLTLPETDLDDEMMAAYKENEVEVWKAAIEERSKANVEKTRLVHYAQVCLTVGILVAAVSMALLGYAAAVH